MLDVIEGTEDDVHVRLDHPWPAHLIAFTGDSCYSLGGMQLDRPSCDALARRAGLSVHPRVTKHVQLLVDCDQTGASVNERKAVQYGIPAVSEADFWATLGVHVQRP